MSWLNSFLRPTTSTTAPSQCVLARPGFQHASETTFNLPLSSNVLFLTFTNVGGPTMSSTLDIVTSPNQPPDVATVRVVSHYNREEVNNGCKATMVRRGDGEHGVDFFADDWVRQQHQPGERITLFVEMIATLPDPSSPLVIKRLETDVGNADQKVVDLKDKVRFKDLYLKGTNGDIHVGSLQTDRGRIETTNGKIHVKSLQTNQGTIETTNGDIQGQFNASKDLNLLSHNGSIQGQFNTSGELNLSTRNGRIQADVGLTSIGGSKARVSMGSLNGAIDSIINLFSSSGSGGSFEASATTEDGRLNVKFPTAPVDSKLTFVGESKHGETTISMNPAYEGTFNLRSKWSIPKVNEHRARDPSGKNRKRVVLKHTEELSRPSQQVVTGQVFWEEVAKQLKTSPRGTVDVQTKHGNLVLIV